MNKLQAASWWQKEMDKSVAAGEDPDDAIERISAEQSTKIFARVEDKPRVSALDELKKIQPGWKLAPVIPPPLDAVNAFTRPAEPKPPVWQPKDEHKQFQPRVWPVVVCDEVTGERKTILVHYE